MSLISDIINCVCKCLKAEGNRRKWRCTMDSIRKLCGWATRDSEPAENNGQAAQGQEIPQNHGNANHSGEYPGNMGPAAGYEVAWWQDPVASHQHLENPSHANALVFSDRKIAAEEQSSSSVLEISVRRP